MNALMDHTLVAWAAGLFEGEGSFGAVKTKRNGYTWPHATVVMTDRDVLERFQQAVGGLGIIRLHRKQTERCKAQWGWRAARFEHAQAVAAMLWPWLMPRRREQIRRALNAVRQDHRERRIHRHTEMTSDAQRQHQRDYQARYYLAHRADKLRYQRAWRLGLKLFGRPKPRPV